PYCQLNFKSLQCTPAPDYKNELPPHLCLLPPLSISSAPLSPNQPRYPTRVSTSRYRQLIKMVRMCKYNTHSIKIDEAYNALNLLGQSARLPDGTPNPVMARNAPPTLRRATAERGRKKKIF